MGPLREAIRYAIFESLINPEKTDITSTMLFISNSLAEASEKIHGLNENERFNIELYIPLLLPPGKKKGTCLKIIEDAIDSLHPLSGGSTISRAQGFWRDENTREVHSDKIAKLEASIPMKDWHIVIQILKSIIKQIQTELKQFCVYMKVDGNSYGNSPIDLLGPKLTSKFTTVDEKWIEDPELSKLFKDDEKRNDSERNISQKLIGDSNIPIYAKDQLLSSKMVVQRMI